MCATTEDMRLLYKNLFAIYVKYTVFDLIHFTFSNRLIICNLYLFIIICNNLVFSRRHRLHYL